MPLFDELVSTAIQNQPSLSALRIAVEKELLHHDIFRILSQHGLLKELTFIGGTCLRACYGGERLSEDLDFTGGSGFDRKSLSNMGTVLKESLYKKYGLTVEVSEPTKDTTNVDTWKVKIQTRPAQKHFPAQRINIDICAVPSYDIQPVLLLNPYSVDMGTQNLAIQAQSQAEIYTDKLLAFVLRPNRIKYRDLWDILWLHQKGIQSNTDWIPLKLKDRNISADHFQSAYKNRLDQLQDPNTEKGFKTEMERFLPKQSLGSVNQNTWQFLTNHLSSLLQQWV